MRETEGIAFPNPAEAAASFRILRRGHSGQKTSGDIIGIALTPRNLGAGLGIVAAVVTVSYIGWRLHEATAPVPTSFALISTASAPVSVQGLVINDQEVLPGGWTAGTGGASAQAQGGSLHPMGSVALPVGRPVQVRAALALPLGMTAVCSLEPRPHGTCMLTVRFVSPSSTQCAYECQSDAKADPTKP